MAMQQMRSADESAHIRLGPIDLSRTERKENLMTLTTYPELQQGSEEWLKARCGIVTASVVGELVTPKTLTVARNDKSRALTALLVAERITGWSDPNYVSADMARGHDIEPVARAWYAETRSTTVDELGFMLLEQGGWSLGFSPDGLIGSDGLLEIKAPRAKAHLLTHVSGEIPAHHMPQIQAGLLVSGREYLDFVSYYAGLPPFVKRAYPDQAWFDVIEDALESFEENAAEMQGKFDIATEGLPPTERVLFDLDMIL